MKLDVELWASFQVKDILSIHNGKGITTEEITENAGDFAVVQSGEENNGVLGKIDLDYCKLKGYTYTEKPCLTVARSGSAGFVSFQKNGCVVGDSAKILLLPDEVAKTEIYLFLHSILTANRFKYDYGRKVTEYKYMNDYIDLPTLIKGRKKVPDFEFMENYIKSLHYKPLTTKNRPENALALNIEKWGEFLLTDIFSIDIAKSADIGSLDNGDTIFIGRTDINNGVQGFVAPKDITKGNCITISMVGTNIALWQEKDFQASQNIAILRGSELNRHKALFICSLLNFDIKLRYSYGRTIKRNDLEKTIIKLPINHKGEPDFEFMENYIKSLPYGDRV
ncbi:restriction endonuclease subunit S [Campylobacter upsaliensis]|uniref:restriction endonuclease subunit S n=1 Tax=Campylobacter upsaliensis TaxID=28080 RepID=UPI00214A417C|nr:restriction endonuclease subunit S [Campylobacter upsaliensis]MCR2097919.1 restriction endonuclease subunit S [Campylobacter upsaliensis]MCR2110825.1 restriction endonuclease subunit S [Campylobacter upsaliensis]